MKQDELIVGKWYNFNNPNYKGKTTAKFRGLSKDGIYFLFSEFVGDNKHEFYNGSWNLNKCTNKLTDLTEIQPFLPENHPDKISIKYVKCTRAFSNDYTVDKIYKVENGRVLNNTDYLPRESINENLKNYYTHYDFILSTKEEFDKQNEWIPKVGEYAVMENAGGYGYCPGNNGCVAIINYVIQMTDEDNYTISGKVINPKSPEGVKFWNVPIKDNNSIICRKALPHEIPDDFVLPEKWCVKTTEVNEPAEVYKWRNGKYFAADGYIHNDSEKWWSNCIKPGYTEITFEQFKKYVLKEEYHYHIDNHDSAKSYDFKVDDIDPSSSGIYIPKVEKKEVNTVLKLNTDYPKIDIRITPKVQKVNKLTIKPIKIKI